MHKWALMVLSGLIWGFYPSLELTGAPGPSVPAWVVLVWLSQAFPCTWPGCFSLCSVLVSQEELCSLAM